MRPPRHLKQKLAFAMKRTASSGSGFIDWLGRVVMSYEISQGYCLSTYGD